MRLFETALLTAILVQSVSVFASDRIFTYFEGRIQNKKGYLWQIATTEGQYWIDMTRPPSWFKRNQGGTVSFWVAHDQVRRYRPILLIPARHRYPIERLATKD